MRVTGSFVTEHHVTELALVGFDSQMNSQMSFEIAFLHKLFGTVSAFVSRSHVYQQVFIEGISSVKLFATMLTCVGFVLLMMNNSMIVKTIFGYKPLATNTAQKWIAVRMINLKFKFSFLRISKKPVCTL